MWDQETYHWNDPFDLASETFSKLWTHVRSGFWIDSVAELPVCFDAIMSTSHSSDHQCTLHAICGGTIRHSTPCIIRSDDLHLAIEKILAIVVELVPDVF